MELEEQKMIKVNNNAELEEILFFDRKIYNSEAKNMKQLEKEEEDAWKFEKRYYQFDNKPKPFLDYPRVSEENNKINADISEIDYQLILETLPEHSNSHIRSKKELKEVEILNLCYLHLQLLEIPKEPIEGEVTELHQANELRIHYNYMKYYKTEKCHNKLAHNESECFNYHSEVEARRAIQLIISNNPKGKTYWNYYPVLCTGKYCNGFLCKHAHTLNEINYHPLCYKCLFCTTNCKSENCEFVHWKRFEENIEHIRNIKRLYGEFKPIPTKFEKESYKTFRCLLNECNDSECLGYHNEAERRRKRLYYKMMCGKLLHGDNLGTVKDCSKGDKCNYCHSLNELKYHGEYYKKKECTNTICKLGQEKCSYIHNEDSSIITRIKLNTPEDYKLAIKSLTNSKQVLEVISVQIIGAN